MRKPRSAEHLYDLGASPSAGFLPIVRSVCVASAGRGTHSTYFESDQSLRNSSHARRVSSRAPAASRSSSIRNLSIAFWFDGSRSAADVWSGWLIIRRSHVHTFEVRTQQPARQHAW